MLTKLRSLLKTLLVIITTLILLLFALLFYGRYIEPNILITNEVSIPIDNLPQPLSGLRIVQISDLHGRDYANDQLAEKINVNHPDLVVITGDAVDRNHDNYQNVTKALAGIKAKLGKYFVTGNNDHTRTISMPKLESALEQASVTVLHNRSVKINQGKSHFWLVGVDDPNRARDDLSRALQDTDAEPKILLAHSPEIIYKAAAQQIDLVLTGHTHGGQVRVPGITQNPAMKAKVEALRVKVSQWISQWYGHQVTLPKISWVFTYNMKPGFEQFIAGLYKVQATQMYVNRGLGETRVPFRIFAPPEITVLELVPEGIKQ